ncbi:MAG: hypothetical protein ACYS0G_10545 [Planctomycetota bacterium]|jgi:hypothetical protein
MHRRTAFTLTGIAASALLLLAAGTYQRGRAPDRHPGLNRGVTIEVEEVTVTGGQHLARCRVTNATGRPVLYLGYGLQSPWYRVQHQREGVWVENNLGWFCGTGLAQRKLGPGRSATFNVALVENAMPSRVGLEVRFKGEAQEQAQVVWSDPVPAGSTSEYRQAEIFRDLRGQVLELKATTLGLPPDAPAPLAVLMETGYPEAVATLVAVADGSASLYFSNGGGIIGGGEHEPVRAACASFIDLAARSGADLPATDEFPLPARGSVRFYVVTTAGVRTAEAVEDDLGHDRHELSPLFHGAQELITAIREHKEE